MGDAKGSLQIPLLPKSRWASPSWAPGAWSADFSSPLQLGTGSANGLLSGWMERKPSLCAHPLLSSASSEENSKP